MAANPQLLEYIKKYLPQEIREVAGKYDIPVNFIQSMPELITLVINSKSIDTEQEKQSWFSLLPLMNDEQIARLNDILTREKAKLAEIQQKYDDKKVEIKKKYLMKWQEVNNNMATSAVKQEEIAKSAEEQAAADALLTNMV
ncbi:MAG: hypothetical protein RLZ54_641 [Candidatus Parcubacteria bacterium]|jgi:uncharacterized protein VirK/YbjX